MSQESVDVVRRWFEEVWNKQRPEVIFEMMTPDAVGHLPAATTVGPAQFKTFWDQLTGAFPDLRVTIEDAISQDDKVVVRWHVRMTHTGPHMGVPPTNKPVEFRGMSWVIVKNGKLTEGWDGWDMLGMMTTIGAATLKQ